MGYVIIEKTKIREIIPKISKLRHYKDVKHKREYASAIKIRFEKEQITDALLKWKIKEVRFNLSIFVDVIEFVKSNNFFHTTFSPLPNNLKSTISQIQ